MSKMKAAAAIMIVLALSATFPVQFAQSVSIVDGNENYTVYTYKNDAAKILDEGEIVVGSKDKLKVMKSDSLTKEDMTITISRAFPVRLTLAGKTEEVEFSGGTVKELLSENGYKPDKYDEINYPLNTEVTKNMNVKVVDVDYSTSSKKVSVPYSTKKVKSAKLVKGKTKVAKKGKKGVKTVTYLNKIVDGKIESTKVKSQKVTKKPVSKKVLVGTKKEGYKTGGKYSEKMTKKIAKNWVSELKPSKTVKLTKNGIPVQYKKVIKGTASAYCTGTTCSTGVRVKPGYIAVNPAQIPYGSKLFIRTPDGKFIYGYAVAADTGGFVAWGNTVADLYMSTYSECIAFGRRDIEMYVL